jgi:hypothetical protein
MTDIMQVLKEIDDFEWGCRRPSSSAAGNELAYPPIIAWRYKEPTPDKADLLRRLVGSFQGTIQWELEFSPKPRAWVLMPSRINEYTRAHRLRGGLDAAKQLMVKDPDFGIRANAELRLLAEHMRQQLGTAVVDTRTTVSEQ